MTRREFHAMSVQSLMAVLAAQAAAEEHDPRRRSTPAGPGPTTRPASQPTTAPDAGPLYRMYPLPNGRTSIREKHAFYGADGDKPYDYQLYVWLILGGPKPILVDAGLVHVDEMNRGAAAVLATPIVQAPGETVAAQLNHFGLTPADIGHVLVTHMHYDHVDGVEQFSNAIFHIGRREFEGATANDWHGSWCDARILDYLCRKARDRVHLVDDGQEVLPGIRAIWTGGHTPGCMAWQVRTKQGRAIHTGDVISLYANFERGVPAGVYTNIDEGRAAIERIRREADVVLASHDPDNVRRRPPRPAGAPLYTIRALKCGECDVRDFITFYGSESQATSRYFLYIWVIEGGERPIVVETGPKDIDTFNRGTAKYIPGGIRQTPDERTPVLLRRHGIDPASVSHVIVTHLHADHYEYFDAFPEAQLVANRHGFLAQLSAVKPNVMQALAARWPQSLRLVEDEEIVPGIRTMSLGCHSIGSQGIIVDTRYGPIVMTGDVAYKYDNVESDRHIACPDPTECRDAVRRVREISDLFLPAHDPRTLERWPGGRIAFAS